MRRNPRVLVLRLFAVALALFTARLVATDLATLHKRAAQLGELRHFLEARRDLPLGIVLRSSDLRLVERHASQVPETALRSMEDALGQTVIVPLVARSLVLSGNLAPATRLGSAQLIAPGKVAMRVVSPDGLRPAVGSAVRIIASLDPAATIGGPEASSAVVSAAARVLAVDGGSQGRDLGVLVEVRSDEAARVAFAGANGVLTLALLPPEDACCAEERPSSRP